MYRAFIGKTERIETGQTRVAVNFTGTAGEPSQERVFTVTTLTELQRVARAQKDTLESARTEAAKPTMQAGQEIDLSPIVPPAPSAEQVWQEKAARLLRFKALGLTNATAVANLQTLEADVNATYVAAYAATL